MHVYMWATRRRAKRRVSVQFFKIFGEQLFLAARCAHDKMAVLGRFCIANIRPKFRPSGAGYENCYESGWNECEYSINLDEYIFR